MITIDACSAVFSIPLNTSEPEESLLSLLSELEIDNKNFEILPLDNLDYHKAVFKCKQMCDEDGVILSVESSTDWVVGMTFNAEDGTPCSSKKFIRIIRFSSPEYISTITEAYNLQEELEYEEEEYEEDV